MHCHANKLFRFCFARVRGQRFLFKQGHGTCVCLVDGLDHGNWKKARVPVKTCSSGDMGESLQHCSEGAGGKPEPETGWQRRKGRWRELWDLGLRGVCSMVLHSLRKDRANIWEGINHFYSCCGGLIYRF